jgi:hypothetical protein
VETKYVVIDPEGNASFDPKGEEPEAFASFRSAEKRAKEMAQTSPGETIGIFELTGEVCCPVGKVESHRKHPIEHYK